MIALGWVTGVFGLVLVYEGFRDRHHGVTKFDTSDKFQVIIGTVFILAALVCELRSHRVVELDDPDD